MSQDTQQWIYILVLFIALSIKFYKIETKLDLLKDQIRALKGEIPEESVGK